VASLVLLLVFAAAPRADGACNETCRRDIARCMATQCAGVPRAACRRSCKPAAIRTLAYALSECSKDAAGMDVWRQALRIRRGDREPITVAEFGAESTADKCSVLASFLDQGYGGWSVDYFPLQRLGVSPDAATIVFEVNDESSLIGPPTLSPEQKGFFLVRSDGRGLRRLGPASRDRTVFGFSVAPPVMFSPNGRRIAFTDRGPGPGGEEAVQIVALDLATGERTQVTHLPTGTPPSLISDNGFNFGSYFLTCCPTFLDDETVLFQTFVDPDGSNPEHKFAAFTVRIDGSGLTPVPQPVAVPGSEVVPSFGVTGLRTNLLRLSLPGTAEGPPFRLLDDQLHPLSGTGDSRGPIGEVFLQDGRNLLQLTNFHLQDTFIGFVDPRRMRAFFLASADPLGTNPLHICQMFSIDTSGSGLRQVTHIAPRPPVDFTSLYPGCFAYGSQSGIGQSYYRVVFQDPVTEAVVFDTGCDPLGTHAPLGEQIFAMRPDGHGLRQLTDAAGITINPDGSSRVELPGPYAYSAPRR
jgi:hypothetical protein